MNWLLLTLTGALLVAGFVLWGVAKVLVVDRRVYARFWQGRRLEPVEKNAIRLVALGDSTFQGLGASSPMKGTVGLIATYLEEKTGRAVHVDNVSVTGAQAAGLVTKQLPLVDIDAADIIVVAIGANDALQRSDLKVFERSIKKLTAVLPAHKTIMADVAMVRDRDAYQTILEDYREAAELRRGEIEQAFRGVDSSRRQTAKDFFHPSDYGYEIWFAGFRPALDKLIISRSLAK